MPAPAAYYRTGPAARSVEIMVKAGQDASSSFQNNSARDNANGEGNKSEPLLGVRMETLSSTNQFLFCTAGILFFYMIYGYVQEALFHISGMKSHALYLTLAQFALYSCFSYLEMRLQQQTRKIPIETYLFLAFLTLGTMGLSNLSLGYLNYPTQVIFKSCKLIPVMIGSVIIVGRRYGPIDISAVMLMCVGLAWFTLADSAVYPQFNYTGILIIMLALCADALIGNYQEKAMKQHDAGNTEVVLYSYGIGFGYLLAGLVGTGNFLHSVQYFNEDPVWKYSHVALYALSGYLGIKFVLTAIKLFGALVAVTVTTLRKALTMTLSFIVFSKPFTVQYLWSGLIILLGVSLNVYGKNRARIDPLLLQVWLRFSQRRSKALLPADVQSV
eukprot:scpid57594/ scgid2484/ Adenosine 3&apos; PAPS transporter 2; Solute carrier family 35 member B3